MCFWVKVESLPSLTLLSRCLMKVFGTPNRRSDGLMLLLLLLLSNLSTL